MNEYKYRKDIDGIWTGKKLITSYDALCHLSLIVRPQDERVREEF